MTRINIDLGDELHKDLKVKAAEDGVKLKDFIKSLLTNGLKQVKQNAKTGSGEKA